MGSFQPCSVCHWEICTFLKRSQRHKVILCITIGGFRFVFGRRGLHSLREASGALQFACAFRIRLEDHVPSQDTNVKCCGSGHAQKNNVRYQEVSVKSLNGEISQRKKRQKFTAPPTPAMIPAAVPMTSPETRVGRKLTVNETPNRTAR